MKKILIIDDDKSICKTLGLYLSENGFEVSTVFTGSEGIKEVEDKLPRIVILDIRLPDMDGLVVLKKIKETNKDSRVIMITAFSDMETTINAMKQGAYEYIHKPIDIDEVDLAIRKAMDEKSLAGETDGSLAPPCVCKECQTGNIIGKSKGMKEIFKTIGVVSEGKATVLIEGETGTGKELIAMAIHCNSREKDNSFVVVNCSAIVDTLLESELFGHEKGAFTGAISRKEGRFELAHGGTIFLDEIGEMSLNLQAKLLRVLQEKEFERVGGRERIKTDCRIIAATNKRLSDLIETGGFRKDLYYRLKVVTIEVPPLRERKEDIPLLVEHLLDKIALELHKRVTRIPPKVMDALIEYDWPGNVRELENVLTRAVVLSRGDVLNLDNLFELPVPRDVKGDDTTEIKSLKEVEKKHIYRVLQFTQWNKGEACKLLGITYPTLRQKIKEYGLKKIFNPD
ncbi:MAG: sigma-54-dependent Fis family transcriptional regulator [Deltaproteobacteria bacterium]|nr:sigma-54-dependent Fis family transcriptional regulator [Deltaproteobacteria bacterium]